MVSLEVCTLQTLQLALRGLAQRPRVGGGSSAVRERPSHCGDGSLGNDATFAKQVGCQGSNLHFRKNRRLCNRMFIIITTTTLNQYQDL